MLALLLFAAVAFAKIDPTDIRIMAPPHDEPAPSIARPQSGSTLEQVGGDWAQRQFHLMTNGNDEKMLESANRQLASWFDTPPDPAQAAATYAPAEEKTWYQPSSVRMDRPGRIEFGFAGQTKLSCDVSGEVNLSRPLRKDVDLRLHHQDSVNSLQLQIPW